MQSWNSPTFPSLCDVTSEGIIEFSDSNLSAKNRGAVITFVAKGPKCGNMRSKPSDRFEMMKEGRKAS
jgi:hypothetical protein